jgi:lipopolysaccharide export LptBFGC system permease protein LptF
LPLCLATNWLLATAAPQWKYAQRNFVRNAKEGAFRNFANARGEIEFGDFYMQYKSSEGNRFQEVMLNLPKTGGKELTLMADAVDLSFDRDSLVVGFTNAFVLSDAVEFESSAPVVRLSLAELFPPSGGVRKRAKYQSTADLKEALRSGELKDEKREEIVYRIHERRALAITYVLFLLLGVPTGTMLRSGTQLGAITGAVGYAFLYYLLAMRLGKELAAAGAVPAVLAAWATTAVFLVAGVGLMLKALWR